MRGLVVAMLIAMPTGGDAQPAGHDMRMARAVLFTATASSREVVPKSVSAGTATAGIVVDRFANDLRYDVTYNGLEHGAPARITLRNFGAGGTGKVVAILCGQGGPPCPGRASARLAGAIGTLQLTNHLLSELVSSRVYIEIEGGDGQPEIRGQLATNGAMVPVRNYVARLAPRRGEAGTGEGTAVLSETYLPNGRVAVSYSVTVAGTSGQPEAVSLASVDASDPIAAAAFLGKATLPSALRILSRRLRTGGTFTGRYVARRADRSALLAVTILEANRAPAIVVRTSRFPRGELSGVFTPVE